MAKIKRYSGSNNTNDVKLDQTEFNRISYEVSSSIQYIRDLSSICSADTGPSKEKLENAKEKAELARIKAKEAAEKKTHILNFLGSIQEVQNAVDNLADAQLESVNAQEVFFENQKKIAETVKGLFALGCSNIAANRAVIKQLREALDGVSGSSMNETARSELEGLIIQLKSQQDYLSKLDELKTGLLSLQDRTDDLENYIRDLTREKGVLVFSETKPARSIFLMLPYIFSGTALILSVISFFV